jgi:hypothetical protein
LFLSPINSVHYIIAEKIMKLLALSLAFTLFCPLVSSLKAPTVNSANGRGKAITTATNDQIPSNIGPNIGASSVEDRVDINENPLLNANGPDNGIVFASIDEIPPIDSKIIAKPSNNLFNAISLVAGKLLYNSYHCLLLTYNCFVNYP